MLVASVIVTYNPDKGFVDRLKKIKKQSGVTIIVDNGSRSLTLEELSDVIIFRNSNNLGIAAAINQGLICAIVMGATHACLFDQDSDVSSDLIKYLLQGFEKSADIAIVGANFLDVASGRMGYRITENCCDTDFFSRRHIITSGSILRLDIMPSIGLMREDLFIDYVDIELCERIYQNNYRGVVSRKILMNHSIGNSKPHNFFGYKLASSNHSVLRRYYMARNSTRLLIENMNLNIDFSYNNFMRILKMWLVIVIFEDRKILKSSAIMLGILDGSLNRMGVSRRKFKG